MCYDVHISPYCAPLPTKIENGLEQSALSTAALNIFPTAPDDEVSLTRGD